MKMKTDFLRTRLKIMHPYWRTERINRMPSRQVFAIYDKDMKNLLKTLKENGFIVYRDMVFDKIWDLYLFGIHEKLINPAKNYFITKKERDEQLALVCEYNQLSIFDYMEEDDGR